MPLLDSFECGQGKCRQGRTDYHEKVTKSHGSITDDDRRSMPSRGHAGKVCRYLMTGDTMAIEPDTKNWTWVLDRSCPDCGFDPATVGYRDVPRLTIENASAWQAALTGRDIRLRPDDSTWSPLEYAAHVRDVHIKFAERIDAMLTRDVPEFDNWDQDATAIADRYGEQDPARVATELTDAAARVAHAFAGVTDDALSQRGLRSDGSEFTIKTLAIYFIHDPIHHLYDVTGIRFGKN